MKHITLKTIWVVCSAVVISIVASSPAAAYKRQRTPVGQASMQWVCMSRFNCAPSDVKPSGGCYAPVLVGSPGWTNVKDMPDSFSSLTVRKNWANTYVTTDTCECRINPQTNAMYICE